MQNIFGKIISYSRYIIYFTRCIQLFKSPIKIMGHYLVRSSPKDRIVKLRSGFQIYLSTHPHDIITVFVVFAKQDYSVIKKGSVVIDIGSNIGVFSIYASISGASKVYSYEPNEESYQILLKNIKINSLSNTVVANKYAVSANDDSYAKIPKESSPYNKLSIGDSLIDQNDLVPTITLGKILKVNQLENVDLLKIDCEGQEYPIFFGAKPEDFRKIKEIRMEFHEGPIDNLLLHLEKHGFQLINRDNVRSIVWLKRQSAH